NSGRFVVERFINTGTNTPIEHGKSWQFLSTPTLGSTMRNAWQEGGDPDINNYGTWIVGAGGLAAGFDAVNSLPSLKYYDPLQSAWIGKDATNTPNSFHEPRGYMVFVRGDRQKKVFNATPNNTILRSRGRLLAPG